MHDPNWHDPARPLEPVSVAGIHATVEADTREQAETEAWKLWDAQHDSRPPNPLIAIKPALQQR